MAAGAAAAAAAAAAGAEPREPQPRPPGPLERRAPAQARPPWGRRSRRRARGRERRVGVHDGLLRERRHRLLDRRAVAELVRADAGIDLDRGPQLRELEDRRQPVLVPRPGVGNRRVRVRPAPDVDARNRGAVRQARAALLGAGLPHARRRPEHHEEMASDRVRAPLVAGQLELLVRGRDPAGDFGLEGLAAPLGVIEGDELLGLLVGRNLLPFGPLGGRQEVGLGRPVPVLVLGKLGQGGSRDRQAGKSEENSFHKTSKTFIRARDSIRDERGGQTRGQPGGTGA